MGNGPFCTIKVSDMRDTAAGALVAASLLLPGSAAAENFTVGSIEIGQSLGPRDYTGRVYRDPLHDDHK
jgi:hypothetical protein